MDRKCPFTLAQVYTANVCDFISEKQSGIAFAFLLSLYSRQLQVSLMTGASISYLERIGTYP